MSDPRASAAGKRLPPTVIGGQSALRQREAPPVNFQNQRTRSRHIANHPRPRNDRNQYISLREETTPKQSISARQIEDDQQHRRGNTSHLPLGRNSDQESVQVMAISTVRACTCRIKIEGVEAFVLIDTGSMVTIVNPVLSKRDNGQKAGRPVEIMLKSASGHEIAVSHEEDLKFTFGRETRRHIALVCPDLLQDAIIGFDFIRKHNVEINAQDLSIRLANSGRIPLRAADNWQRDQGGLSVIQTQSRDPKQPSKQSSQQLHEDDLVGRTSPSRYNEDSEEMTVCLEEMKDGSMQQSKQSQQLHEDDLVGRTSPSRCNEDSEEMTACQGEMKDGSMQQSRQSSQQLHEDEVGGTSPRRYNEDTEEMTACLEEMKGRLNAAVKTIKSTTA